MAARRMSSRILVSSAPTRSFLATTTFQCPRRSEKSFRWKACSKKTKGKLRCLFTSPVKDFFFICDVITSPEKEKRFLFTTHLNLVRVLWLGHEPRERLDLGLVRVLWLGHEPRERCKRLCPTMQREVWKERECVRACAYFERTGYNEEHDARLVIRETAVRRQYLARDTTLMCF